MTDSFTPMGFCSRGCLSRSCRQRAAHSITRRLAAWARSMRGSIQIPSRAADKPHLATHETARPPKGRRLDFLYPQYVVNLNQERPPVETKMSVKHDAVVV